MALTAIASIISKIDARATIADTAANGFLDYLKYHKIPCPFETVCCPAGALTGMMHHLVRDGRKVLGNMREIMQRSSGKEKQGNV